jgi:hypothetical protein
MNTIEIKTSGTVVTRNGEFKVGAIRLDQKGDKASLTFVSGRLRRVLHAGCSIEAEAMDKLAMRWAEQRGLIDQDERSPASERVLRELDEVEKGLVRARHLLMGDPKT